MVKNHLGDSQIQIQIPTKIESITHHTFNLCNKVCPNPSITFLDIVLTDKQMETGLET